MEQVTTNPVDDGAQLPGNAAEADTDTGLQPWSKPAVQVIQLKEALTGTPVFGADDGILYYS